jgi:transcriptional antiterminator NusG
VTEDSADTVGGEKPARWFIVHTYSGFEQRVEKTILEMMRTGQEKGQVLEVVVPTEKVVEMVKGERRTTTRKFYPGYVMVKMILTDDSWHLIQSIPRVTGFVGRTVHFMRDKAQTILSMMEQAGTARPKFNFERGDEVGSSTAFSGFNGVVEDVN